MGDPGTTFRPEHDPLPEGEEQAPPGTRGMAVVRWILVAVMAAAAAGTWIHHVASGGVLGEARALYRCPMHPTVVSPQRGECPICGMDLVAAGEEEKKVEAAKGHPATAALAAGEKAYTCPMHPAFVTADPKARCPDCGMKLVPKDADAGAAEGPAAAVPGLTAVELNAERIQLIGMKTALAARERLPSTLRTVGFVTAPESGVASVTARYTGWIETVSGDTGRLVERGDVLATVASQEIQNASQAYVTNAKWRERSGGRPAGTAGSVAERDARRRLELLGLAGEDIDALGEASEPPAAVNVRSPVRGYVARRAAVPGLYVGPGTELFQIADLSSVWVLADVYESEIGRVKVGQRAVLELAAYPGERFAGRVQFISPAVAAQTRTLQARIEFRNPRLRLRPGMYGDVTLDTGSDEALVVPSDALVDTGEVQYVFVSKGAGRFEPRRVRAGWSGGGKVAILEGLAGGERVVTTANFLLDSESRLRAAIEGFAAPGAAAAPAAAHAGAEGHEGHGK